MYDVNVVRPVVGSVHFVNDVNVALPRLAFVSGDRLHKKSSTDYLVLFLCPTGTIAWENVVFSLRIQLIVLGGFSPKAVLTLGRTAVRVDIVISLYRMGISHCRQS